MGANMPFSFEFPACTANRWREAGVFRWVFGDPAVVPCELRDERLCARTDVERANADIAILFGYVQYVSVQQEGTEIKAE
jgi:hypothetical protein